MPDRTSPPANHREAQQRRELVRTAQETFDCMPMAHYRQR